MNYALNSNALNQYQRVAVDSAVDSASPHRLVQMLMDGALQRINAAKGHLQSRNIPAKGQNISLAITIIDNLKASLDMERGGAIAQNLSDLYFYMENRLVEANLKNDADMLDEVANLMRTVKSGWDAIPEESRTVQR